MKNLLTSTRGNREKGFTLIELLVVIVIIGILAAIAIPVFNSQRGRAQDATVTSDVRNIITAAESWRADPSNQLKDLTRAVLVDDVKTSPNVKWGISTIKGTDGTTVIGYCVAGFSPLAKTYKTDLAKLTYNSTTGRLDRENPACASTSVGSETSLGSYDSVVRADSPVAYFKLDETSGTSMINAITGASGGTYNNVTLNSVASPLSAGGKTASFNGSSSFAALSGTYGGTAATTVEAWYNVTANTGDLQAILSAPNTAFLHLQAFNPGSGATAIYTDGGQGLLPAPTNVSGWHHVVVTTTGGSQVLYIDGVSVGTASLSYGTISTSDSVTIGKGFQNARFFNGAISNVSIYNKVLTPAQVSAHYNAR